MNASTCNVIEIALAANQGYAKGLLVAATSIALNASRHHTLSFTILDGGLTDEFYDELVQKLRNIHSQTVVQRFRIDESLFAKFPDLRGNKMTYARFYLPDLLLDAHHVIYCDVDTLWLTDIADLWALCDDTILKACNDPTVECYQKEIDWFVRRGIEFDAGKYFNAGVLLINLDEFRKNDIVKKACNLLSDDPSIVFHDQSTLNYLLWGKVRFLNDRWMKFTTAIHDKDMKHGRVLHYVNNVPWVDYGWREDLRDTRLVWFKVWGKVNELSLYQSLKSFWGTKRTIRILTLSFIVRLPILRQLIILLCILIGRKCHASFFYHYARYFTIHCS